MARGTWLVKTEPSTYAWGDLVRDGRTRWDGVRNFAARGHLGGMRAGDLVLVYHSGDERAVVGVARVAGEAYPDPTAREGSWLAVDLARRYGDGVRVNAIAPGFFVAEQNRAVLVNPDGSYTPRALAIIAHTPMGRFGRPEELNAAVQWLCSDSASFITVIVLPIDGGFSAFSGV